MDKCASCKKDVPEGAKFCPACGNAAEAAKSYDWRNLGIAAVVILVLYAVATGFSQPLNRMLAAWDEGAEVRAMSPRERSLHEMQEQRRARDEVKRVLGNAGSAQFMSQKGPCGEVNFRDSDGQYVGYQKFIAARDMVVLEREGIVTPREFDELWILSCR